MKPKILAPVALLVLVMGVSAYLGRGYLRDAYDAWRAPNLPPATAYRPSVRPVGSVTVPEGPSPFEAGYSTSEHYMLETDPVMKAQPSDTDLLSFTGTLPTEVNLAVPFMSQAPTADWGEPYQEACEEASAIMVDAFYRGESGVMDILKADAAIQKFVGYEKGSLGFYEDTTAAELAKVIRDYYGYRDVVVQPFDTTDDLKRVVALGYPVIVPMSGKLLNNPNFRNGGPLYHMLVIRGYANGLFITNDPGTRKGEGYTYDEVTIMNAAHDWNGGEVTNGQRVMLVIIPNPS